MVQNTLRSINLEKNRQVYVWRIRRPTEDIGERKMDGVFHKSPSMFFTMWLISIFVPRIHKLDEEGFGSF
jgi:hypothetical protein